MFFQIKIRYIDVLVHLISNNLKMFIPPMLFPNVFFCFKCLFRLFFSFYTLFVTLSFLWHSVPFLYFFGIMPAFPLFLPFCPLPLFLALCHIFPFFSILPHFPLFRSKPTFPVFWYLPYFPLFRPF